MARAAALPRRKPYDEMTLDDLRELVKQYREQTLILKSNFERIQKEYEDWEDRVAELDKILDQAEKDTGITKEQVDVPPIQERSLLDDIFDDMVGQEEESVG